MTTNPLFFDNKVEAIDSDGLYDEWLGSFVWLFCWDLWRQLDWETFI